MKNTLQYLLATVLLSLNVTFSGCDKEMTGYGKYAIAIDNPSEEDKVIEVLLDGESKGSMLIKSGEASPVENPEDFNNYEYLVNVFIINVAHGEHEIKLVYNDGTVKEVGKIFIQNDARISQKISL